MRTKSIVVCLVGVLLPLTVASSFAAETRTWTKKDGTKFEGEFVKVEKGLKGHNVVTLWKADGSEMKVGLEHFSPEDRKYVLQTVKSRKNEEDLKFIQQTVESRKKAQTKEEGEQKPTGSDQPGVEKRTWTHKNGKTFEAEFVKMEHQSDGKNIVTLQKTDGSEITVGAATLSPEDRKYVLQTVKSRKNEDDLKFIRQMVESRKKTKSKEDGGQMTTQQPAEQPTSSANAERRTWTHKNGKTFEAEFVKLEHQSDGRNIVTLRKSDGAEMTVGMMGLSEDDRKYVKQMAKGAASQEAPANTSASDAPDQPPADPPQQRGWLQTHLLSDVQNVGTFDSSAPTYVSSTIANLTDDQIALLCQYYLLTRSKAEQDASLYSLQQQGGTDEQVNAAKAQVGDLLTEMQNQGDACYGQIQTLGEPVQYLAQIEYASLPGWCASTHCYVPSWYYDNGSFVGPYFSSRYCSLYAPSVYAAYYNHESHFYQVYHSVDDRFYRAHSTQLALRSAKYFREHDVHRMLAHDRLIGASSRLHQAALHDAHLSHASERSNRGSSAEHANVTARSEHANAAARSEHANVAARSEHTNAAGRSEHTNAAARSEHANAAGRSEHTNAAARSEHANAAARSEHANAAARSEHTNAAARSEHTNAAGKPASANKSAGKPKETKPTAKPALANKSAGKPKETKPTAKPAPANKSNGKPQQTKPAAKPETASKPGAKKKKEQ